LNVSFWLGAGILNKTDLEKTWHCLLNQMLTYTP
jgi:hypothetical protein